MSTIGWECILIPSISPWVPTAACCFSSWIKKGMDKNRIWLSCTTHKLKFLRSLLLPKKSTLYHISNWQRRPIQIPRGVQSKRSRRCQRTKKSWRSFSESKWTRLRSWRDCCGNKVKMRLWSERIPLRPDQLLECWEPKHFSVWSY